MSAASLDCDVIVDVRLPPRATHSSAWAARLRAAVEGDESDYPDLLNDIGRLARRVARRLLARCSCGDAIVEDIVQETLMAVHIKRRSWDYGRPVEPWAAAVAHNKAVDAIRRAKTSRETKLDGLEDDLIAPRDFAPEARGDVEKLLATLKPRQREIVTAVMLREEPVADVARRLSMTDVAVRVALHRAVKAMGAFVGRSDDPLNSRAESAGVSTRRCVQERPAKASSRLRSRPVVNAFESSSMSATQLAGATWAP
jgi:RNA polymerase sigma-70 factor (ECF subfamily)